MRYNIDHKVLLNRVKKLVNEKKHNQAKSLIKKYNKIKGRDSNILIKFKILEIECLLYTNHIIKAEATAKSILSGDSIEHQLSINNLLGVYFGTNPKNANLKKSTFYLHNSYLLDSSINNGKAIFLLYQLSYSRYDFLLTEQIWKKLKVWQSYFEPSLVLRLQFSFRAGLKEVVENSLDLLLAHAETLSIDNFHLLLDYLLMTKKYAKVTRLLNNSSPKFTISQAYKTYQAQVLFEKNKYNECIELLLSNKNNTKLEIYLLASCYDKLGNYTKAFQYYCEYATVTQKSIETKQLKNEVEMYKQVKLQKCKQLIEKYSADENYNNNTKIEDAELCFMVGFPRSGTTLLENVLDSQDNIYSLSELGIINPILKQYSNLTGKEYPLGLDTVELTTLLTLREEYKAIIANVINSTSRFDKTSKDSTKNLELVIDKLPLNAIHIPFIQLLFPNAKIVFSVRNPLDVIFSCFQQDFDLNQEMSYLVTLNDCVQRYISVLEHVFKCEEQLGLNIHYVKYEHLIDSFEKEVTNIFEYFNVTYDESYKRFHECAIDKLISTPSRTQVIQPIYKSSSGKWKNYCNFLLPYFAKLTPYIVHFGYNVEIDSEFIRDQIKHV